MQAELRAGDRIPMSGDEYQALGSDVRGEYLLVVSPSPTWRHDDIVRSPASFIEQALPEGTWVRHQWARKPGVDEYLPDLVVFDDTDEGLRDTGASHLAVGVLDLGGDVDAEFGAYDEAGLPRYRIIERGAPEIVAHRLEAGADTGRHSRGRAVTLDLGPATLDLGPTDLHPGSRQPDSD